MNVCLCRVVALAVLVAAVGCGGSSNGVEKPDKTVPKPQTKAEVG